jgi:hypothetical protein
MPFTLAHPLAVVPLRRKLVFSALVIGSMAPDFPYFLYLPVELKGFGHSLGGAFLFCVPVGLAALWVFHSLLKEPLLNLLPAAQQVRFQPVAGHFTWRPFKRFVVVVLSLLTGTLTHLAWDSFTHYDGFMVRRLPALRAWAVDISGVHISWCQVLQYGSTAAGLLVLAWLFWRWSKQPVSPINPLRLQAITPTVRWFVLGLVMVVPALLALYSGNRAVPMVHSLHTLREFSAQVVIVGMSTLLIELAVFSLIWKLVANRFVRPIY